MTLHAGVAGAAVGFMTFLTRLDRRQQNVRRGDAIGYFHAGRVLVVTGRAGHQAMSAVAENAVCIPARGDVRFLVHWQAVDAFIRLRLNVAMAAPSQLLHFVPLLVHEKQIFRVLSLLDRPTPLFLRHEWRRFPRQGPWYLDRLRFVRYDLVLLS